MNLKGIFGKIKYRDRQKEEPGKFHEFCPYCEANLTLQKGYSNDLPCWICKGCGRTLINPNVPDDSGISWICDKCGAMLNIQEGFTGEQGDFTCRECGFVNKIDPSEIYLSEAEYLADIKSPYKGLSDEAQLMLSMYEEIGSISGKPHIIPVKDPETGKRYVKKLLQDTDASIYRFLLGHPVAHMPEIVGLYEGSNCLIVIEEYIEGQSLAQMLEKDTFDEPAALNIVCDLCCILKDLHGLEMPIIHRDIKPSNIILSKDGEVHLLDMDAAKWYKPGQGEDTRLYGTLHYAAPEQLGFGFSASTVKSDIYAVGVLLNVLLTGKYPREEKACGPVWAIIERCLSLEMDARFSAGELIEAIDRLKKEQNEGKTD